MRRAAHRCSVSIHAPARGATRSHAAPCDVMQTFRSTLPHGERPRCATISRRSIRLFRSTLPHGERPARLDAHRRCMHVSIHAPARGATAMLSRCIRRISRFRSTLPHGERPSSAITSASSCDRFRSTLPHGERPAHARRSVADASGFDPRSRTGSDRRSACDWLRGIAVSIHAPARGATSQSQRSALGSQRFRSTLPHGERPADFDSMQRCADVSIHAPARGATRRQRCREPSMTMFRSTLPHGERPMRIAATSHASMRFDPRSRTGSDVDRCRSRIDMRCVSIHAPARGATESRAALTVAHDSFDPRSRTGSDAAGSQLTCALQMFRSTLPHGERPASCQWLSSYRQRFDPRSRTGSDLPAL